MDWATKVRMALGFLTAGQDSRSMKKGFQNQEGQRVPGASLEPQHPEG